MKLKNHIMSWILSPGAYAVWHALGDPDEWQHDGDDGLVHKQTALEVRVVDWRTAHTAGVPRPFAFVVTLLVSGFMFDCVGKYAGAIGFFERHLVAVRAYRAVKVLHKHKHRSQRVERNRQVFAKLTVNE